MPNDPVSAHSSQLRLEIVTPKGSFLQTRADMIEFPTTDGELGILPGHTSLVVNLDAGEVRVHHNSQVDYYAVAGGFVEVHADSVKMLAWFFSTDDDEKKVDDACERARRALEEAELLSVETIEREITILRAEFARLAENRKGRRIKR